MQFSWMAKVKDNKNKENSWKDFYFRLNLLNKITKRRDSSAKRLYNKIKSSIEKEKNQKEPKSRNDDSYKFNIKNINIFVSNANSNLQSYNNTMSNNTSVNKKCITKNILKEKVRQNTIENKNQILDISQVKNVKYIHKTKTINRFNLTKNKIFLYKKKNHISLDLTKQNSGINKNYFCFYNDLNTKQINPQKYKTLKERSKTKESEKNNIKSIVKYKKNFKLKLDNYLQNNKNQDYNFTAINRKERRIFSDPNLM